jgi:hypothetical protein
MIDGPPVGSRPGAFLAPSPMLDSKEHLYNPRAGSALLLAGHARCRCSAGQLLTRVTIQVIPSTVKHIARFDMGFVV